MSQFLNDLKNGSLLTRLKHSGEKYSRRFFLHDQEGFISSDKADGLFHKTRRYYIDKIDEIRIGLHTRTFDRLVRHKTIEKDDEERAFSLFFNNYRDEIHLMANDKNTRDIWVEGLQHLIETHGQKRQRHIINETNWILKHFYLADKDSSGTLTKEECRDLLTNSLNAKVSKDMFEKLFKEADISGEGVLTSDEFVIFFHLLNRRKDLYEIMQKYVKNGKEKSMENISMNTDELLYFLRNIQKQIIIVYRSKESKSDFTLQLISTLEQAKDLIDQFEVNENLREKGEISLDGFRSLMLSDDFALMKPWCSQHIYQDMTRPLSDYYINTSHNTYLFNNQITGDSNPEAYNRALHAGCRALEIDCYDGGNSRPIVKHGFTLVKPCLFESIIRFIEPNLFKISPYPVILDLENHCSIAQEQEIAKILRNILGDRLIIEPLQANDSGVLPSPEDLKYKVLLRGVRKPKAVTIPKIIENGIINNDNTLSIPVEDYHLGDLFVYLQNVPYREYEFAKDNHLCVYSSNMAEKLFDRAVRNDPLGIIKQTMKSSLRMYPDGLRQDSSNPNPIYPWNFGIQMVALNYQNDDLMMALSYGKFLDNGGCGYILKPKYLIDIDETKFNPFDYLKKPLKLPENIIECPQRIIIKIISGQLIPRSNDTTHDVPDPYVVISTHGIPCDQQIKKTKFIEDNGFDPMWNETFQFDIYFPQMCLIRFDIYDRDRFTRDDRLLYFCLPLTTMQTGYRHIHLRGANNRRTFASLFIYVEIKAI